MLPEDKFHLVKALQTDHHLVGMCGDGANDALALRQAGIAVSTDTDVPNSAAGIVLTQPGLAGIGLGIIDLVFCVLCLATGKFVLGLDAETLRTLTVATSVFGGQAVLYVARERRHLWSSWPGRWLLLSSAIDLALISTLALKGWLMAPLAPAILAGVFVAELVLAVVLDGVKAVRFRALHIA